VIHHVYELADDLPENCAVDVQEDRGEVLYRINGRLTAAQIIAALNAGAEAVLSGGHWFQEWNGDIISRRYSVIPGLSMPYPAPTTHGIGECGAT
jgi:hypothetical protein